MLRINKEDITGLKYPLLASLTLSFAGLGDAFLYPFLPQYAEVMRIPVVWIGVMLSINRFIRIIFNPFISLLFAKYGVRQLTILAAVMAVISTTTYGLDLGLFPLLFFRIIWGIAFAILRISAMAYAFDYERVGISLGAGRGMQEIGPLIALWLGPILLIHFRPETVFLLMAVISIAAIIFAISLPPLLYISETISPIKWRLPSTFNTLSFTLSIIIEGVLVVTLGGLLLENHPQLNTITITSLAAGYLAFRRISFILFSPLGGLLADKWGFEKTFNGSVIMIVTGLIFIVLGGEMPGLLTVFIFNSINNTVAPGSVAENEPDKIKAVTKNANWRDIGAAIGALSGGFFLSGNLLSELFILFIFILIALLLLHQRSIKFN